MISDAASGLRERLVNAVRANPALWEALHRLQRLELPEWYLGAGCVAQTVWNVEQGNPVAQGIRDYDLVYFDSDLSERTEALVRREAATQLGDLGVVLDVKNQARVHTWYRSRFGYDIWPYRSTNDAIDTWPTTAGAIALRRCGECLTVYAPFGLQDLYNFVVRANRVQITPEIYNAKARRWLAEWPFLRVLPWDQGVGEEGARAVDSSVLCWTQYD